jgi:DNA repair protein RecO (recombination protein O)
MTYGGLVKVAIRCFACIPMGPSQASQAIILRTRSYGESDKIVTFLSEDAGKLTGIAKGAKNSRRRFANCLDAFTRVRAHFRTRPGASLVFLESCDLLEPVGPLSDPAKFAYGSYLVELVDQLTAEGQPIRELYALLAEGLAELRQGPATAAFLRGFELQLLYHTGYDPELQRCGRCHELVASAASVFLDPIHGNVVCAACRAKGESMVPVASETLAALGDLKVLPLGEARYRRFPAATAAEAAQLMGHLLALHLPRPLRSVKLIAVLR